MEIALNDNESHYLNYLTIAAFAKFSAAARCIS